MMRLRRASAIAAFFLLTSAATAHAECAWVLWYRFTEYRDAKPLKPRSTPGRHIPRLLPAKECYRSV